MKKDASFTSRMRGSGNLNFFLRQVNPSGTAAAIGLARKLSLFIQLVLAAFLKILLQDIFGTTDPCFGVCKA